MTLPTPLSKRRRNNTTQPLPTLFDELIFEILSWLPVKSLLIFRSVSKSWKSIISHQSFIKIHLQRSPKDGYIISSSNHGDHVATHQCNLHSLFENPTSTTITLNHSCYIFNTDEYYFDFVGSCNGLICSLSSSITTSERRIWVRFWNPATRLSSKKTANLLVDFTMNPYTHSMFGFGYDHITNIYKVIVMFYDGEGKITMVKIHNMGDTCWRDIQNVPSFQVGKTIGQFRNDGVRISNHKLNWIVVSKCKSFRQFVIASFDFVEENYTQISMPYDFDEVCLGVPVEELYVFLTVLMDCLCISYDDFYNGTSFIVWQTKEYRDEKSWTKILNVSYQYLELDCKIDNMYVLSLNPLRMYKNGDFIIALVYYDHLEAIMYNERDNRVQHVKLTKIGWIFDTDYIESLVSPL